LPEHADSRAVRITPPANNSFLIFIVIVDFMFIFKDYRSVISDYKLGIKNQAYQSCQAFLSPNI
jgi:hypothetical protein